MRNQQVAEAWWKRRVAKTEHLFTDGISIWSYGHHFKIAKFHTMEDTTSEVVLYNFENYSPTTCKHQSIVRNVIDFPSHHVIRIVGSELTVKNAIETIKLQKELLQGLSVSSRTSDALRYILVNDDINKLTRWLEIIHPEALEGNNSIRYLRKQL